MSEEQREPIVAYQRGALRQALTPASDASCELDADGHCVTCSDEALTARVLRVDQETG
jgi:hypothetical protein